MTFYRKTMLKLCGNDFNYLEFGKSIFWTLHPSATVTTKKQKQIHCWMEIYTHTHSHKGIHFHLLVFIWSNMKNIFTSLEAVEIRLGVFVSQFHFFLLQCIVVTRWKYWKEEKIVKWKHLYGVLSQQKMFSCIQVCIKYTHEMRWMQKMAQQKPTRLKIEEMPKCFFDFKISSYISFIQHPMLVHVTNLHVHWAFYWLYLCLCLRLCVVLMFTN